MIHWLLTVTGINNVSGPWYGLWSGIAGDLFIFGALLAFYKKHNCHVSGCWRVGKHSVAGTPYIVCRKHHPAVPRDEITLEHVYKAHRKSLRQSNGN